MLHNHARLRWSRAGVALIGAATVLLLSLWQLSRQVRIAGLDAPLRRALLEGDVAQTRALLAQGADPQALLLWQTEPLGWREQVWEPLRRAVFGEMPSAAPAGDAPLTVAAICHDRDASAQMVRLLLKAGADPNTPFRGGDSLLFAAIGRDNAATARSLVEAGANVNVQGTGGWTPLMFAATRGNAEIVGLLLRAGADPNTRDAKGRRALDYAIRHGRAQAKGQLRAASLATSR